MNFISFYFFIEINPPNFSILKNSGSIIPSYSVPTSPLPQLSFNEISSNLDNYARLMKKSLFDLNKMKTSGEGGFYKKFENHVKEDSLSKAKTFILQKKEKFEIKFRKQMGFFFFRKRINLKVALLFKRTIWFIVEKIDKLKISIKEVIENKIFPQGPLEKEEAPSFFYFVKKGIKKKVEEMLLKNRYLVYEFDHVIKNN